RPSEAPSMNPNPLTSRDDVRRLMGLGAVIISIVALGAVALLAMASDAVDDLQAREERALVERTIARFEARMVSDLTTVTVWDQAYEELKPGGDILWADA